MLARASTRTRGTGGPGRDRRQTSAAGAPAADGSRSCSGWRAARSVWRSRYAGTQALVAAQPADIPRLDEIKLNPYRHALHGRDRALLASIAFGAVPALHATGESRTRIARGESRRRTRIVRRAARGRDSSWPKSPLRSCSLIGSGLLHSQSGRAEPGCSQGSSRNRSWRFESRCSGAATTLQRVRGWVNRMRRRSLAGCPNVSEPSRRLQCFHSSGPGPRQAFAGEGAAPPAVQRQSRNRRRQCDARDTSATIGAHAACADVTSRRAIRARRGRWRSSMKSAVRRWFPDGRPDWPPRGSQRRRARDRRDRRRRAAG